MPSWVSGKHGEKAWKKSIGIVSSEYGAGLKKSDSERFYSLVTTVYKKVCSSPDYECGIGEGLVPGNARIAVLTEQLSVFLQG